MRATDFVYDGVSLSSFGFIVVDLDSESSWNTHITDSQKDFTTVSQLRGKLMPFSAVTYKEAIKVEFSIIKDPATAALPTISLVERRAIKRWLNRDQAHKFTLVDTEYSGIFWEGSFNIEEVFFAGECYALNLTLYTNRPFALGDEVTITKSLTVSSSQDVAVQSDDEGYIMPNSVVITCGGAGTLKIENEYDNRTTIIENCVANEVITLTNTLQISSTSTNHDLANDFNYVFLRLNSDFSGSSTTTNTLSLGSGSIACSVVIKYNPIVKAVIV